MLGGTLSRPGLRTTVCVRAGGLQPPAGGIGGHRHGAEESSQSFLGETGTAIRQSVGGLEGRRIEERALGG